MITNEVYMEIDVLRRHGLSLRQIATEVGCAVNTVRSHLATGQKPRYERHQKRQRKLFPYETYLRERQTAAHPLWIPATVLHREIAALGYPAALSKNILDGSKGVWGEMPMPATKTLGVTEADAKKLVAWILKQKQL